MGKKIGITFILLSSFFFLSCISLSCSKNEEKDSVKKEEIKISKEEEKKEFEIKDEYFQDSFIKPEEFFTLDYTPYLPEKFYENKKLSSETIPVSQSFEKGSSSIIPGLRNIENYKTKYNTNPAISADTLYDDTINGSIAQNANVTQSNNEDFTVITWGPQKKIPASIRQPEFFVMFSEPVVPLAALGSEITQTDLITITPPIEGIYRWNGTGTLSFIPSNPITPQQSYTIKVLESLKSLSGKPLKGQTTFSTTSEDLKIIWSTPGYKYREQNFEYFSDNNVPPEACKEFRVRFNYMVNADEIAKISVIKVGDNEVKDFTVTQENADTVTYNLNTTIPPETKITLTVGNKAQASYSSVSKFMYQYARAEASYGEFSNPVYIDFSHPIDEKSLINNIETSLDYKITKDNIKVMKETVILYNLPVTFKSIYKITLKEGIKDIYGRNLGIEKNIDIEVPDATSLINFTDYGSRILEASYPHRLVFEHQNLLDKSWYSVSKTNDPLRIKNHSYSYFGKDEEVIVNKPENAITIKSEPENTRILEKVDLDPYLTDGKGMVSFEAVAAVPVKRNGKIEGTELRGNTTTIQVTDLGVTARLGVNKSVVLVTKLSDGTPVKDAKVYLYSSEKNNVSDVLENDAISLGTGITDENGVALINYDMNVAAQWFHSSYKNYVTPALLVVSENDAVTFNPTSHSPWRNNVYSTNDISTALNVTPYTFMFSDRGLYKPGEKVTFRGIDRNLNLGTYIPVTEEEYKIKVRDGSWNVILEQDGITSSNGGFYGSFTLPENAEPGSYEIQYSRKDEKNPHANSIYITVAYFERAKFQTSIQMPESFIVLGDTIQANLSASYLAGGLLASAGYHSSWYSEPWYFETDNPEFKDYKFGPLNNVENMSYLNNDMGNLNNEGKAILSCSTSDNDIKGSPYRYRVSADVTDVSNQQISTSAAVIVHPANYYIGIKKSSNNGYLVKKDEETKFDYKLALLDGSEAKSIANITKRNPKLKVELLREDWNTVQQQGINGAIYPRYVREVITESENTYNLSTSGSISVTPSEVGYYTIRLSSKDSKNRDVITEYSFFSTGTTNDWVMNTTEEALKLTPDQKLYNPGETATLLLESPLPKGTYLITVEREGIFTEEVKTFNSSVNTIDIPIARNYVPVCYVSVSSYSVRSEDPQNQYGVADVDKPKGYYGVTPLHVNPYVKAFSVDVKTEKMSYNPGEEATITVTATKGGKPLANAEITLMAVDRGVLDLIDYHIPNPIEYFYNESNFPLRVKGGDDRDYLMDPVTYAVKNLAGGDFLSRSAVAESAMDSKLNERKDFNPTALFEPFLVTDENGQAICKFKLPDTLTTYRVTAFGVKDELLALQESEFQVNNPVNVQQVTPRRLRERDTSELGVILTNLDSASHDITVSLETISPKKIETVNGVQKQAGKAFVDGEKTHTVTVNPGCTISVYFDVAAEKAGIINTEFTVTSDILNEKLIYPVTIEKPYIFEQVTSTGAINGEENTTAKEGMIIPSFAEDGLGSISITLDATRLGPLSSAVKYVFDYPYGCLEQQASRILPLVIFEEYIDVFNMELDSKITDIHSLVTSYFEQWSKCQFANGGFGYWPNSKTSNYYVSARIAQIYAIALERGYTKEELKINIDNLISFLWNVLLESKKGKKDNNFYLSSYENAFIQYVISMLAPEKINKADLEKILKSEESTVSELAFGGLTALELKDKKLAKEFKSEINKFLRPNAQSIDITGNDYNYYWSMYNNTVEHLALTLKLFAKLDEKDPLVTKIVYTLLQNQKQGYWQNTANTSRVLDAFYTLIKASDLDNLNLKASASAKETKLLEGTFEGPAAQPIKKTFMFSDLELNDIKSGNLIPLEFNKEGKGDLYFTTSLRYALPSELQIPRDEGLSVVYKLYDDMTGEEITFDSESSSLVKLISGKTYRMDMTLSSSKDRSYVALRAPIPSGAEILDATFVTAPDGVTTGSGRSEWHYDDTDDGYNSGYYYMDNQTILDNEVQYFWNYFPKGTTKASFKFRAARRGVFPTPPIMAECMYESEIFGRTYGSLYTIE